MKTLHLWASDEKSGCGAVARTPEQLAEKVLEAVESYGRVVVTPLMGISEISLTEEQLHNDDGMYYGIRVTVWGTTDIQEALAALSAEYGDERVFGQHPITDQFHWDFDNPDDLSDSYPFPPLSAWRAGHCCGTCQGFQDGPFVEDEQHFDGRCMNRRPTRTKVYYWCSRWEGTPEYHARAGKIVH